MDDETTKILKSIRSELQTLNLRVMELKFHLQRQDADALRYHRAQMDPEGFALEQLGMQKVSLTALEKLIQSVGGLDDDEEDVEPPQEPPSPRRRRRRS